MRQSSDCHIPGGYGGYNVTTITSTDDVIVIPSLDPTPTPRACSLSLLRIWKIRPGNQGSSTLNYVRINMYQYPETRSTYLLCRIVHNVVGDQAARLDDGKHVDVSGIVFLVSVFLVFLLQVSSRFCL